MPGERYPNTDGYEPSFQSIELRLAEKTYTGFKSLKYKHGKDRGTAEGNADESYGHTRGTYKIVEWEMMVLRRTHDAIVSDFGPGYMDEIFEIRSSIVDRNYETKTDIIESCVIDEEEFGGERGPDALYVPIKGRGLKLLPGGVEPLANPLP